MMRLTVERGYSFLTAIFVAGRRVWGFSSARAPLHSTLCQESRSSVVGASDLFTFP